MKERAVIIISVLAVIVGLTGSFIAVIAIDKVDGKATRGCQEIEVVKTALRETIEQAATFTATSKVRSPAEKVAGQREYNEILARFKPNSCGGTHGTRFTPSSKSHQPHHISS